ncbi:MAG: hypothetical protein ACHREM_06540 [Polyangiales bacterium]
MTQTSAEKKAARRVQELTGRPYTSALNLVRDWKARGLSWEAEIAGLAAKGAAAANLRENTAAPTRPDGDTQ